MSGWLENTGNIYEYDGIWWKAQGKRTDQQNHVRLELQSSLCVQLRTSKQQGALLVLIFQSSLVQVLSRFATANEVHWSAWWPDNCFTVRKWLQLNYGELQTLRHCLSKFSLTEYAQDSEVKHYVTKTSTTQYSRPMSHLYLHHLFLSLF